MKKLLLACVLCVLMMNVHAQQSTGAKAKPDTTAFDTASIPKKYRNIHKRSPVLACVLSVYIPGLGQVYNKQLGKAAIVFGTTAISFGAAEIYYNNNKMH